MKRPRSEIQSVIVHQKGDEDEWIPRKFERNSWVKLSAPKRGKWARKGDVIAQINYFKMKPSSPVVESILVAHAYTFKQLRLDSKPAGQMNYIYPSKFEDWQDPAAVLDVVVVLHAEVGEMTRGIRSHKDLLEKNVFFYNAMYIPSSQPGKCGRLIPLPLPSLDDPSWPIPDMWTSEAFRDRLYSDIQLAMKPKTGSRVCSVHWFLPFYVFIDLFSVQCTSKMHRTATLYVFKPASDPLLASLMDDGWDTKIIAMNDVIRCRVLRESISFRYHIGRSTLYTTFGYIRDRLVGGEWVAMDLVDHAAMFSINVEMLDGNSMGFQVGKLWTFSHFREELRFYGCDDCDTKWVFTIASAGSKTKKINRRQEKQMLLESIEEGHTLCLVTK